MQRMAPLATVLVLLGPGTALAASPAPDAAPAGADAGALSPDPVPTVPTIKHSVSCIMRMSGS